MACVPDDVREIVGVVAALESHGKNVGSVAMVHIPVIANQDVELLDLYLFIDLVNVWNEIWAESQSVYDLVQEVLKGTHKVFMVV